jgi:hypothetical protein
VNLGGEPERDDFGLPPVDIEVPDDARELDRDVQAYRRELRALRRRQRRLRLHAPFTRDGVVLPLLASCLVLALIAGTLLTVFTAGPGEVNLPGHGRSAGPAAGASSRPARTTPSQSAGTTSALPADSPAAVLAPGKLPASVIEVGGRKVQLRDLPPVVLALVPAACDKCTAAVRELVTQAAAAQLTVYLVGSGGQLAATRRLAAQAQAQGKAIAAQDASGVLRRAYPPAGLTALLVHSDGTVAVARFLGPALELSRQLRALRGQAASAGTPPRPATSPSANSPPATSPPVSPAGTTAAKSSAG